MAMISLGRLPRRGQGESTPESGAGEPLADVYLPNFGDPTPGWRAATGPRWPEGSVRAVRGGWPSQIDRAERRQGDFGVRRVGGANLLSLAGPGARAAHSTGMDPSMIGAMDVRGLRKSGLRAEARGYSRVGHVMPLGVASSINSSTNAQFPRRGSVGALPEDAWGGWEGDAYETGSAARGHVGFLPLIPLATAATKVAIKAGKRAQRGEPVISKNADARVKEAGGRMRELGENLGDRMRSFGQRIRMGGRRREMVRASYEDLPGEEGRDQGNASADSQGFAGPFSHPIAGDLHDLHCVGYDMMGAILIDSDGKRVKV